MPDGSLLNRYWDARDTPRDESYVEDIATSARPRRARRADQPRSARRGRKRMGLQLALAARWQDALDDPHHRHCRSISTACSGRWKCRLPAAAALGDTACAQDFTRQAEARKAAISKWLWSARTAFRRLGPQHKAADQSDLRRHALSALRGTGDTGAGQATAKLTKASAGGSTTTIHNGQQWDQPNGWAPLTWVAVEGCARTGRMNWPSARSSLDRHGFGLLQPHRAHGGKYNIETGEAGGGGEYPVQDGFGWTNGVTRALTARYPNEAPGP
jgi:alpha,alpha-trehalase